MRSARPREERVAAGSVGLREGDDPRYAPNVKLLGSARGTGHFVVAVNDRGVLFRLLGFWGRRGVAALTSAPSPTPAAP